MPSFKITRLLVQEKIFNFFFHNMGAAVILVMCHLDHLYELSFPLPMEGQRRTNMTFEPRHEKTDILHMRKQRRRSASR